MGRRGLRRRGPARYGGAPRICGNAIDDDCDLEPDCDLRGEAVVEDLAIGSYAGYEGVGAGTNLDVGDADGDGAMDLLMTAPVISTTWVFHGPLLEDRTWFSADAAYPSGDWGGRDLRRLRRRRIGGCGRLLLSSRRNVPHLDLVRPHSRRGGRRRGPHTRDLRLLWLAGSGDLDGDGFDELLLGESATCGGLDAAPAGSGCAEIFFGPLQGALDDGAVGSILVGEDRSPLASDPALLSVDLTGDGTDDVFLVDAASGDGHFYVVEGPVATVVSLVEVPIQLRIPATLGQEATAPAAGDLDGDGYEELLAGARSLSFDPELGEELVFRGPLTGALDAAEAWVTIPGVFTDAADLSSDVDGDGQADLVLGTEEQQSGDAPGQVRIYYHPEGSALADAVIRSAESTHFDLGLLAPPGDVDGDGVDDVITGGTGALLGAGGAWIFPGQPTGY